MTNDFANRLANTYDINIYRKKDPEQQYKGFSYAMNNLLRNVGNGFNNSGYGESFIPNDNQQYNPLGKIMKVGLPFAADMIWGNKYDRG